jgi:hypothetical protein
MRLAEGTFSEEVERRTRSAVEFLTADEISGIDRTAAMHRASVVPPDDADVMYFA